MNHNAFTVGLALTSFALVALVVSTGSVGLPAATGNVFQYNSVVCTELARADGTHYTVECSHNFLTPAGRNLIMDMVGGGATVAQGVAATTSNASQIALCNITSGVVSQVSCYGNGTAQNGGLINASGTFFGNVAGTPGNWSITKTFTATTDGLTVNGTLLLNGSSTGAIIFANNTFTQVTLNTNDQITIRWNISVS